MSLGFLRKEHAPTTESAASFPVDIEEPPKEIYDKTIMMKQYFRQMKIKRECGE